MKYKVQDDILTYTARECNITQDHLKIILSDFWSTIRQFLTNPLETKRGILINEFGLFYMKPYTVKKKKELLIKRTPNSPKVNEHELLIKQITKNESTNN